ncbi:MAG: adenylate/guanylate cyclase domain-containing protein, partial [Lachnospiraceae bacterium]|nr:adenylate/guanylate cyclase domain-containing protein [Lachnospiraceae bacterium]
FGRSVSFGVGVNWGPAVVGNIGAPLRMDYTAIGDTVNTAARLEANAPGGKVYISRAVADELGDRITCTSLGDSIKLKGKAEGFEVLELNSIV